MPRTYEATARIALGRDPAIALHISGANGDGEPISDSALEADTQIQVLSSDTLALAVIRDLGLQSKSAFTRRPQAGASQPPAADASDTNEDPGQQAALLREWHRDLEISKIPRTRMIAVTFRSQDARLAADVVNTLLREYSEQTFRARYDSTLQATNWLTKQLVDLQLKVEISQRALVDYQQANSIVGIDEKQNITIAKLDALNRQLTDAEADRIGKQANYELSLSKDANALPALQQDTLLQNLRQQEAELQRQYAQLSVQMGPAHPRLVEIEQGLKQLQVSIASEIQKVQSRARGDYQSALSRENLLHVAFEKQKLDANELSTKAIRYLDLKREAEGNRNLYEDLQNKLKEASIASSLRQSNITVVDPARIPDRPSSPNIPRNLLLGVFAGLAFGVMFAFIREHLDNTIHTPEQAMSIVELPSLGTVPLAKEFEETRLLAHTNLYSLPASKTLVSYLRPNSNVAESYRAIRTALLLSSPGKSPQVVMITSALPQEGKSTTTVNTGIVLAQKGSKVLLVDADLRCPFLHKILEASSPTGLSALLTRDSANACRAAVATELPNLFMVSAGVCPPNPAELLASDAMRECIVRWRSEFDFILIDTPPVLSVTDAVALSPETDGVVLVLRSGTSTRESLRRSCDLLTQVGAKLTGFIVNGVDLGSADAYYYGYGGEKNPYEKAATAGQDSK
jgi:capsular exopolysaccharide synthesis family protein